MRERAVQFSLVPFYIVQGVGNSIQAYLQHDQVVFLIPVKLLRNIRFDHFERASAVSPY